jgi:hypothetical protein
MRFETCASLEHMHDLYGVEIRRKLVLSRALGA